MPNRKNDPAYHHEIYLKTREKRKAKQRAQREYAKERRRATDILWRYGIGQEQYQQLYAAQAGCCAICRVPFDGLSRKTTPHIDHLHERGSKSRSGQVRGILCGECNRGLGEFRDNPDVLRAASEYLANPPAYAIVEPKPQLKLFEERA